MRRSETIRRRRDGYTLIELLVVIAIIALLAGLLLQAIIKIRDIGPRVRTQAEIGQMELAVESFKSTYQVKYVPSALILSSNYAADAANNPTWAPALRDSQQYLSKVWPKVGWGIPNNPAMPQTTPNVPITLDGNQVLVFLLGGVGPADSCFVGGWAPTNNRSGFLNSPTNPFNMNNGVAYSPPSGDKAKGPFFDFKIDRINGDSHYLDYFGWPYYYFSAKNGNDYNFFGIYQPVLNKPTNPNFAYGFNTLGGYGGIPPGTQLPNGSTAPATGVPPMNPFVGADGKFIRSDTFQIVSAGKNNLPGPGGFDMFTNQVNRYTAGIGAYGPGSPGGDDIANFHSGMLSGDN